MHIDSMKPWIFTSYLYIESLRYWQECLDVNYPKSEKPSRNRWSSEGGADDLITTSSSNSLTNTSDSHLTLERPVLEPKRVTR